MRVLDNSKSYQVGGDHYLNMKVQPWDIIDGWDIEESVGFYRGNILKYIMRMHDKDDPITNVKKAMQYCSKLIEVLENARK